MCSTLVLLGMVAGCGEAGPAEPEREGAAFMVVNARADTIRKVLFGPCGSGQAPSGVLLSPPDRLVPSEVRTFETSGRGALCFDLGFYAAAESPVAERWGLRMQGGDTVKIILRP